MVNAIIIIFSFVFSSVVFAQTSVQNSVEQNLPEATPKVVLVPERFGTKLSRQNNTGIKKIANWNPQQKSIRFPQNPECTPYGFNKKLRSFAPDAHHTRAKWIQENLESCAKTPSFLARNRFLTSVKSNEVVLDLERIPGIQQYQVSSPSLEKTRFLATLQKGKKPAILIVCGTGCNLLNGPAKSIFAWLRATTDSHIFLLGSGSGSDSIRDNSRFLLGGAEEGSNIFHLLSIINTSPEFSGRISEWNLLGMSLGGHSVFYAGIYLTQNPWNKEWPQVRSITGYCPVVNLRPTLTAVDTTIVAGKKFRGLLSFLFRSYGDDAGAAEYLPPTFAKKGVRKGEIEPLLSKVLLRRYRDGSRPKYLFPYPFDKTRIHSIQDYWDLNDYRNHLLLNQIPTTIIGSESDFVVNPEANQISLQKFLDQTAPHPRLSVIDLKKGGHCGQAGSYSWELMSQTFSQLMKSQSQDPTTPKTTLPTIALDLPSATTMNFDGYRFELSKSGLISLVMIQTKPFEKMGHYRCDDFATGVRTENCFSEMELPLPEKISRKIVGELSQGATLSESTRSLILRALNSRFAAMYSTSEETEKGADREVGLFRSQETTRQIFLFPVGGPDGNLSGKGGNE